MPFDFKRLNISDLVLITPRAFQDARGYFMETYKRSEFVDNGLDDAFVQDNFSHSVRGVLRGLHFQKAPEAQAKLVKVVRGAIFDVAVDIRRDSPTFGQWQGVSLTEENGHMFYIPAGFAHGFCVLSEEVDFTYKVSAEYAPALDRGVRWNDPAIGIDWPMETPLLSEKDEALPLLETADLD
tara:strand:+ start:46 stop:591 length:546 start_codon:yes stop_codon:yes gene_type:complete